MGDQPELIWMRPERPARGPQPAYSRAAIAAVAVELADAKGIAALSMRRVAAELGAGTMSLYRYVTGKDELIDLMIDAVLAELALPGGPTGDWRADLTLVARGLRDLARRHPWYAEVGGTGRTSFAPNQLRLAEFTLGCLDGLGLSIDEIMSVTGMVISYVEGVVRGELSDAADARRSGLTEEQWRFRHAPYLRQLLASGNYPMLTRVVVDARQPHMDRDERFEYGLARILNGVEASLPRHD